MGHKEVKYLAQSYSATNGQTKDSNPAVWLQSQCTWPHSTISGKHDTDDIVVIFVVVVTDSKEERELTLVGRLYLCLDQDYAWYFIYIISFHLHRDLFPICRKCHCNSGRLNKSPQDFAAVMVASGPHFRSLWLPSPCPSHFSVLLPCPLQVEWPLTTRAPINFSWRANIFYFNRRQLPLVRKAF